jgi:hypothetical protein
LTNRLSTPQATANRRAAESVVAVTIGGISTVGRACWRNEIDEREGFGGVDRWPLLAPPTVLDRPTGSWGLAEAVSYRDETRRSLLSSCGGGAAMEGSRGDVRKNVGTSMHAAACLWQDACDAIDKERGSQREPLASLKWSFPRWRDDPQPRARPGLPCSGKHDDSNSK